jgi:hypothetical protein
MKKKDLEEKIKEFIEIIESDMENDGILNPNQMNDLIDLYHKIKSN